MLSVLRRFVGLASSFVASPAAASTCQRWIHATPAVLMSSPLKKKKRMDPQILRAREEKRKRKLAKALKKMEKKERICRPLIELRLSADILSQANGIRKRTGVMVSEEESERRALLLKEWHRFNNQRFMVEIRDMDDITSSQNQALNELRMENRELYLEAIKPDSTLIPLSASGPTYTPPIRDYLIDGAYEDVTKQFSVQYADMKAFMRQLLMNQRRRKIKQEEETE